MRKQVLVVLLASVFGTINAQQAGEKYLGIDIDADFGTVKESTKFGSSVYDNDVLYDPSYSVEFEFGYFVTDNIKAGFSAGYGSNISKEYDSSDNVLKSNTNLAILGASASYYKKLADHVFYTPEIGAFVSFGNYNEAQTVNKKISLPARSFGAVIAPLSFEIRATDMIAFGASFCTLNFVNMKLKYEDIDAEIITKNYSFSADSSVSLRLYF